MVLLLPVPLPAQLTTSSSFLLPLLTQASLLFLGPQVPSLLRALALSAPLPIQLTLNNTGGRVPTLHGGKSMCNPDAGKD